jgi:hypothetical protein
MVGKLKDYTYERTTSANVSLLCSQPLSKTLFFFVPGSSIRVVGLVAENEFSFLHEKTEATEIVRMLVVYVMIS